MLLYVGPDQIVPLSGALGTIAGFVLVFWGRVLQAFEKLTNLFSSKSKHEDKAES